MQEPVPSFLNLLAPDGIVGVIYSKPLNGDQCIALLSISQTAKTVEELEQGVRELGTAWGIPTQTEIVSRSKRLTETAADMKPAS
jgi:hypothetical protein